MASTSSNQPEQPVAQHTGVQNSVPARPFRDGQRRLAMWRSVVLVALTCVCLLASIMTIWASTTVLNTDRFVSLVAPLGRDPQVINSVSGYVADQVVAALDIPRRTAAVLPANAQFLVAPLEQRVHDFIQAQASGVLNSDQMQATWSVVERTLHAEFVAALRGQSSTVAIANGVLSVDLLPLIAATLSRLQQTNPGLIPSGLPLPALSGGQSPEQQRHQLAQALGVQLAPDFGVVTVVHSDALVTAQRIVAVLDTLQVVLPIVTVVLAAAAVWAVADWRRTLLSLGIGTAICTLMASLLVRVVLGRIVASVTAVPAHAMIEATVGMVWASLWSLLVGVLIASALAAVGGYVAGNLALASLLPRRERNRAAGLP